jgi:hypothetical protein
LRTSAARSLGHAAEHASKAAAVGLDDIEHLTSLGDAHAVLVRDVGIPDRAFGVEADSVGRRTFSEVGPYASVAE